MREITIYGLCDPRNQQIKYVGKTVQPLNFRLSQHIHHYGVKKRTKKSCWITQLLKENLYPEIFEIERIDEQNWIEAERFWIAYFKSIGCDLKNIAIGGEGNGGNKLTEQHKAKIAIASTGKKHTEEAKRKISEKAIGRKRPWTIERNKRLAKITKESFYRILSSEKKNSEIAKEFNICKVTVWQIKSGLKNLPFI